MNLTLSILLIVCMLPEIKGAQESRNRSAAKTDTETLKPREGPWGFHRISRELLKAQDRGQREVSCLQWD